jgi:hypothetical protein
MAERLVRGAVEAFMARDLDGILARAAPEIELRSLLTEAERPLYHGHDGVREWFDAVFGVCFPIGARSRGPRPTTRTVPS